MRTVTSLFWLTIVLPVFVRANDKYKMCVVASNRATDRSREYCSPLLADRTSQVECEFAVDKIHCIRKILSGDADFGVFKPEEISYAATKWNDELSVTNEIRIYETEKFDYSMVVLVNEDANIKSLDDLKGKQLCHPGFFDGEAGTEWSSSISQYFERVVVSQKCDPQLSVIENQLKSLSQFFGDSCKPGQWDPDPDMDMMLKNKYPSLCENCKNPSKCSSNDQFWGRQGALQCLSDCFGDVSWARLSDVRAHFIGGNTNACSKISFLCPNGTLQPMETASPCTWVSQPWSAVMARNSESSNVQRLINFANTAKEAKNASSWQSALNNLLMYYSEPISSNIIQSPIEYLSAVPNYMETKNDGLSCTDRSYSMCVQSIKALKKCEVLSDVSTIYGIQPKLKCIRASDCGNKLKDGKVDIIVLDADEIAFFRRNHGVSEPVLYATSMYHHLYRKMSAVMLKKNVVDDIGHLRGKKACFPLFDGYVWNSFLLTLKLANVEMFPKNETVKNFFGQSCAILSSDNNSIKECGFDENLPINDKNGLWIETQTLACIIEGGGDVAFLNTLHINQYIDILRGPLNLSKTFNVNNFSTVCNPGIRSSTDCPLSWSNFGQILVKSNISSIAKLEIISLLLNMDMTFGRSKTANSLQTVFAMYGPFDEFSDPMFPADTEKLETTKRIKERRTPIAPQYESYISTLYEHSENSSAQTLSFALLRLLIIYRIVFEYYFT